MKNINYLLAKDNETKEIVYMEYDKINGYKITPKTKALDAINVNKIVFVNPSLTEKLIKKKLEIKLRYLLENLNNSDDTSSSGIRETLVSAERLKLTIINKYLKYLGSEYANLTLKKLELIINELRFRLFSLKQKEINYLYTNEEEPLTQKGRGR